MKVGVLKETVAGERRVALVPDAVGPLTKLGIEVVVQAGAGDAALFTDSDYQKAGARIVSDAATLYRESDVVLKVQKPTLDEAGLMREGAVLIGFLQPSASADLIKRLDERKVTGLAMEAIPRISRAQSMDALSSQANVAGYKAVLVAANSLTKFLPMMTTAAGTIRPAKVLILGAGVAGLQAIATARRLGAVVWAYDVRAVVKEQIESLGAKFLEFDLGVKDAQDKGGYAKELSEEAKRKQQQMLGEKTKEFDVVITTALIPGTRAATYHQRNRGRHETGIGHRRSCGGGGRQLRVDRSEQRSRQARCDDHRPDEPAEHAGRARQPALRAQRRRVAQVDRQGWQAEPRLQRRDHQRRVHHAQATGRRSALSYRTSRFVAANRSVAIL